MKTIRAAQAVRKAGWAPSPPTLPCEACGRSVGPAQAARNRAAGQPENRCREHAWAASERNAA